jgi:hypothetical protein
MNEVAEKIEEQETQQDLDFGEDKPVETKQQEETSFEVEIVDDRPEEDRVPKRKEDTQPKVEGDEDEAKNYSDKVQKRIKELKYEYHEERRAKEEASRLQEEALNYAKKLQKENEELRKSLFDGENVLINQAKGRVDAQLEKAKIDYKDAYESGDPDKLADASAELARIQNEKYRVDTYTPPKQPQPRVEQPKPIPQQPQKPQVSQRALDWANENTWFNKDSKMTSYAFGVHEELVKKGVVGDGTHKRAICSATNEGSRKWLIENQEITKQEKWNFARNHGKDLRCCQHLIPDLGLSFVGYEQRSWVNQITLMYLQGFVKVGHLS